MKSVFVSVQTRNVDFFYEEAGCARTAFQSTYYLKKNLRPAGAGANAALGGAGASIAFV